MVNKKPTPPIPHGRFPIAFLLKQTRLEEHGMTAPDVRTPTRILRKTRLQVGEQISGSRLEACVACPNAPCLALNDSRVQLIECGIKQRECTTTIITRELRRNTVAPCRFKELAVEP